MLLKKYASGLILIKLTEQYIRT